MFTEVKPTSALVVRTASTKDLDAIVSIHLEAFPGFFLTSLGSRFLCLMYQAFAEDPNSVFVSIADKGKIVGFVVGAGQQGSQVRRMAFRKAPRLALAVAPALLKNPLNIASHLLRQLFSLDGHPVIDADALVLRSIAVASSSLGTGAASQLLQAFEREVAERGYKSIFLTTDAVGNDRVKLFYQKAGYSIETSFVQKPSRLMNLYKKTL